MKTVIIALLLMFSAYSNAQTKTEKGEKQENINLTFSPESIHGTYGINYYFQTEGGTPQRAQFEVSVVYCGQYMEDYSIYHITKSAFVINRNVSNAYLYDIAKSCAAVIYPVTVLTDRKGAPICMRINDVEKKWLAARSEMDHQYPGEVAEQYLNNVENFVGNQAEWKRILTYDLFLSHLFSTFVHNGEDSVFDKEITLIPFRLPLVFDCSQSIGKEHINPEYEVIRITREGVTNEPYKSDLFYSGAKVFMQEGGGQLQSKFKLQYTLDKNNSCVEAIEGDFAILVNDKVVSTTRITAFRLYEKPLPYGEDPYFAQNTKKQEQKEQPILDKAKPFSPTEVISKKYLQEMNKVSLENMSAILPINLEPCGLVFISEE